jgi:predicted naringenin-chalcone synthase
VTLYRFVFKVGDELTSTAVKSALGTTALMPSPRQRRASASPFRSLAAGLRERGRLAFELTPDALHARFLNNASAQAAQAAQLALADAHIEPKSIEAVIVNTCSGYLCPGLTSYLSEQLGLSVATPSHFMMRW